jgi:hypothetical protein
MILHPSHFISQGTTIMEKLRRFKDIDVTNHKEFCYYKTFNIGNGYSTTLKRGPARVPP